MVDPAGALTPPAADPTSPAPPAPPGAPRAEVAWPGPPPLDAPPTDAPPADAPPADAPPADAPPAETHQHERDRPAPSRRERSRRDLSRRERTRPPRWRRGVGWALDRPFSQLGTALLLLGLVISAPFGGWAPADQPAPTRVRPGTAYDNGPLRLTLDEILWVERDPGAGVEKPALVMVRGTVRNTTDRALGQRDFAPTLRVVGMDGLAAFVGGPAVPAERAVPALHVSTDGSPLTGLSPGLTYPVVWVVDRVPAGGAAPASARVSIRALTLRRSSTTGVAQWLDPSPTAVADLTVRRLAGASVPEPLRGIG